MHADASGLQFKERERKDLSKTKEMCRHLNLFICMEKERIEMASEIQTIKAKSFPMSQLDRKRKSPGRHVCGKVAKAHKYSLNHVNKTTFLFKNEFQKPNVWLLKFICIFNFPLRQQRPFELLDQKYLSL